MTFFMDELTHIKLFTGPYCDILRFFVGIEMRRDCRFDWPVPHWSIGFQLIVCLLTSVSTC